LLHQKSYPAVRCPGAISWRKLFLSPGRPQKGSPLFPENDQQGNHHKCASPSVGFLLFWPRANQGGTGNRKLFGEVSCLSDLLPSCHLVGRSACLSSYFGNAALMASPNALGSRMPRASSPVSSQYARVTTVPSAR